MDKKKSVLAIGTLLLATAMFSETGFATSGNDDYKAIIQTPSTQIPSASRYGFFNVQLNPGQTETLPVDLTNLSDHPITIDIKKGVAGTSSMGSVVYTTQKWPAARFNHWQANISDGINLPTDKVTIQPGETSTYKATLTMPEKAITGQIAGGLSFTEENQHHSAAASGKGLALNNIFIYEIAVVAQNNLNPITPKMTIDNVQAENTAGQTAFSVDLKNVSPTFANTVTVDADITGPNGVHYRNKQKMMQFAPNTSINWQVWANGKKVPAGEYKVKVDAYWGKDAAGTYSDADETKFKYHTSYVQQTHISDERAKNLADKDGLAKLKQGLAPIYKVLIAAVLLLVLLGLWFFLVKRREVALEWLDENNQVVSRESVKASRVRHYDVDLSDNQQVVNADQGKIKLKDRTLIVDGRVHVIYIQTLAR